MGRALSFMIILWIIIFIVSRMLVAWWSRSRLSQNLGS
jgi:hypothetical protein